MTPGFCQMPDQHCTDSLSFSTCLMCVKLQISNLSTTGFQIQQGNICKLTHNWWMTLSYLHELTRHLVQAGIVARTVRAQKERHRTMYLHYGSTCNVHNIHQTEQLSSLGQRSHTCSLTIAGAASFMVCSSTRLLVAGLRAALGLWEPD